jgi:hypothetical protein
VHKESDERGARLGDEGGEVERKGGRGRYYPEIMETNHGG